MGRAEEVSLNQLDAALTLLGALDPQRMPLHHAHFLVFLAIHGRVTYRQIEDRFNITNASASRIVNSLLGSSPHRKNCLDLVEVFPDPAEGRRKLVRLNTKGRAMAMALRKLDESCSL